MKIIFSLILVVFPFTWLAAMEMASMSHGVKREVSKEVPRPILSISLSKDQTDGYNLHLNLRHYEIQPPTQLDGIQAENKQTQGHAHLYINGEKIGRLYGYDYHLPQTLFNKGINNIKVTLNDHNHNVWVLDGKEILSSLMINTLKEDFLLYQFDT